ncbi:hypothetical protein HHI36_023119 [Cryptolaemus montrouzieri]|uniref:5'-nucleotidase domain-containing protein 1 n=1 Tax=Cryptolaemus montrouzieri TaxID=559131 RepID=A0ABD2PG29_9CUCU
MAEKDFDILDYDCIGFDLDNTLARYKATAMVEMEYEIITQFLIKNGFPKKHLLKPLDFDFLLKGLILDIEKGNILKVATDGKILSARHGTRMLSKGEINNYYPNYHWDLIDLFIRDPQETWNGPNSEIIRALLDNYDIIISLVYARLVDSIDEENSEISPSYSACFKEIHKCFADMFTIEHFRLDKGEYYAKIKAEPNKYYYKCTEALIQWLKMLKKKNKLIFLITGSYIDFASLTASNTLGPKWKDYFDIIITYAKKPGFFTQNRDFIGLDDTKMTGPISYDKLQLGGIYCQGNWADLQKFLSKYSTKSNPKFLYMGDNIIQDVHAPSVHTDCDTVAISEELFVEENHCDPYPEEKLLKSTIWGSYFRHNHDHTIWYKFIKDNARCCVPSVDFLIQVPLEKNFEFV